MFNPIAAVPFISLCLEIWTLASCPLSSPTVSCFKFVVKLALVAKDLLASASELLAFHLESFFPYPIYIHIYYSFHTAPFLALLMYM